MQDSTNNTPIVPPTDNNFIPNSGNLGQVPVQPNQTLPQNPLTPPSSVPDATYTVPGAYSGTSSQSQQFDQTQNQTSTNAQDLPIPTPLNPVVPDPYNDNSIQQNNFSTNMGSLDQSPVQPAQQYELPNQPATNNATGNTLDLSTQPDMSTQSSFNTAQPIDMQPGVPVQPEAQATPALDSDYSLNSIPTDFGLSNNAMVNNLAVQQERKKTSPLKYIIIGVVALAVIVIISLVALFVSRGKKTTVNVQQVTQPITNTTQVIPTGYQQLVRDCYSFAVLLPTTVDFKKTVCKVNAKFGSTSQYDLVVEPVTDTVADGQALVDKAKTLYNGTISTQSDIKLNNLDTKKVIMNISGSDRQVLAVLTAGKNYTFNSKAVTGFLISSSYSDETSKNASDILISSWQWK